MRGDTDGWALVRTRRSRVMRIGRAGYSSAGRSVGCAQAITGAAAGCAKASPLLLHPVHPALDQRRQQPHEEAGADADADFAKNTNSALHFARAACVGAPLTGVTVRGDVTESVGSALTTKSDGSTPVTGWLKVTVYWTEGGVASAPAALERLMETTEGRGWEGFA